MQERLDEARPVLARALEIAPSDRARAATHVLRARAAARQGRLEEALAEAALAEDALPDAAPTQRAIGHAYAQVWQWEDAARVYEAVADAAPGDVFAWRDLARARGSVDTVDRIATLDAAAHGLGLGPRNPDLLRSQSLAVTEGPDVDRLRQIFLRHRVPDQQPQLLRACQRDVPGCDRDRQPIPEITLRQRQDSAQ